MSNQDRSRQPAGVPTGGQFASEGRAEADLDLSVDESSQAGHLDVQIDNDGKLFVDSEVAENFGVFGDIEGDEVFGFRASRQLDDGEWEVCDVTYGECTADETVHGYEPGDKMLMRSVQTIRCTDPNNPGGTEVDCDIEYSDHTQGLGYTPGDARLKAEDERRKVLRDPYCLFDPGYSRFEGPLADRSMPIGTPAGSTGTQFVNSEGRAFNVRHVPAGSGYGRDYAVENDEAMIEFYDATNLRLPDESKGYDQSMAHGQFVSRYHISTLRDHPSGVGLNLDGGVSAWSVDAQSMDRVSAWLATKDS